MLASALLTLAQEPGPGVAAFFARGIGALVVGTAGDERADRGLAAQTRFIGELLFPQAPRLADTAIPAADGAGAWPDAPLVYGGEHVNTLVAALGPALPLRVRAHELTVASETFTGDEYRLLAFVPGRAGGTPSWPDFVWFAGTGTPGVAEINAYDAGSDGFLVVDRFGPLAHGRWSGDGAGGWKAEIVKRERRLPWRRSELLPAAERWSPLSVLRLEVVGARPNDAAEDAAIVRGARAAAGRLGLEAPAPFEVYVYPDRGSLRTITSRTFDGRADVESRTLHVLPFDAASGGPLESLLRHEATHVLAYERFGAPGSTLLGEGLAVWVSGAYQQQPLAAWKAALRAQPPSVSALMGVAFQRTPEATSYPFAGLFVESAIALVGRERFLAELYPASAASWDEACARAGTSAAELERAFHASLER